MPAHHHRPDGTHAISTRNALKTRRENVTKLALVTGGAHPMGIGFASAKALVKIGYEVIVTGYSTEETALTPETPGISTRVLDVTDDASIAALIGGLTRLDALVNCAGHATPHEFEIDQFARTVEVNLTGTMRMSRSEEHTSELQSLMRN